MKGRASHGRQVPVPHVIPWFLWMSHCPQPIGLFNGIPQSSGFEHTSTGAYPAFLRFTGNVVPPFEEPRGSQLRLMRYSSHKPPALAVGSLTQLVNHRESIAPSLVEGALVVGAAAGIAGAMLLYLPNIDMGVRFHIVHSSVSFTTPTLRGLRRAWCRTSRLHRGPAS